MSGIPVEVLPVGEGGLLLEVADLPSVLALAGVLRPLAGVAVGPWRRVTDVVPAAGTVLLATSEGADLAALAADVRRLAASADPTPAAGAGAADDPVVEVPVVYDGPDLDEVARLTGLAPEEVVTAHTGTPWQVAFGGFAPGFAYLVGGDPRLAVPRRDTPRASVPAGSVGLAGAYSGVYPRSSPGGWQLLGVTDAVLWDVDRDPPALLAPGHTVRFVAVDRAGRAEGPADGGTGS
ncbi:allophanate hydrolase subunit 1 [Oryzobacter terrae]|uniref:5-oxoprolinase subunit B family protein n=1 Tax=Oryzobacter terrae TaxID=1620385 RepID=UPI00367209FD